MPVTAKSGQGGGVVAGPTADVEIPPARREGQISGQTTDFRRIGPPRGVITIANLVVVHAHLYSLVARQENNEEINILPLFATPGSVAGTLRTGPWAFFINRAATKNAGWRKLA